MKKRRIRLLIVDDHPIVISGVKNSLESERRIQIVGEATTGKDVLSKAKELVPDIVLLDISLPGLNGLQVTRRLVKELPGVKVVAFSMHDDREYILGVVHAGAKGYILKETSTSELIKAITTVFAGDTYFSPPVAQTLLNEHFGTKRGPKTPTVSLLTKRENEILALIGDGLTNKAIADKLDTSPRTIQTHRQRIMKKLDIHTAVDLTRFAIAKGISTVEIVP
jgi:two-component system nitrate/nitrite response regulator NarL